MNFEWEQIAKEIKKQQKTVMTSVKVHFKDFYKDVKKNVESISFIVLLIYWIHIKLNLDYLVVYSVPNMGLLIKNYLELIFNNSSFKFFTTKNNDIKFLKVKLPKIIANSSNGLVNFILEIFKSYNVSIEFKNLKSFVDSIICFYVLNDNVKPFKSELEKNVNNVDKYNNNVEIFLYSLEVYKNARDAFVTFDRENLANVTVAINRLAKYLAEN